MQTWNLVRGKILSLAQDEAPLTNLNRREKEAALIGIMSLLLFAGYLFWLPEFKLVETLGSYNEHRIQSLLLFTTVCTVFLLHPATRKDWLRIFAFFSPVSKALLVALPAIGLISAARAAYPLFAILEVAHFCLIFLTIICLAAARVRLGSLFDWLAAIAFIAVAFNYTTNFALNYYAAVTYNLDLTMVRNVLLANFSNIRFFSQWQSWTLALVVLPLLLAGRLPPAISALFLIPAMGWWLLFFTTGTRGTLLGCLIAFPLTLLCYRRRALPWLRWQVMAIGGGLTAYLLLYYLLPEYVWPSLRSEALLQGFAGRDFATTSGRFHLWSMALATISRHPWLGIGPMHSADLGNIFSSHPHNALLQIASEWGLPALLMVLVLLFMGLRTWLQLEAKCLAGPREQSWIKQSNPALFAALLTATIHAMLSGIIVMPVSQVMLALVLGWMIGIAQAGSADSSGQQPFRPSRRQQALLLLFFCLVMVGLARPLAQHLPILAQVQQQYVASERSRITMQIFILHPRFWQLGYLSPYYRENGGQKNPPADGMPDRG